MKRFLKWSVFTFVISMLIFTACKEQKQEVKIKTFKEKKKVRKTDSSHKKGIEHMADYQLAIRKHLDSSETSYEDGYLIKEFKKAKQNLKAKKSANSLNPVFIERGPVNVPGRTRGIAVDPTNNKKWFVGTVGGGVWKTEDEGQTWVNLTDAQLPNLATSTIAISQQDKNTLYAGTGEPFGNLGAIGGSGIFKTTDGGVTWTALTGTSNFGDIGRLVINPNDKNNVIVAAKNGIYRTTNGGVSWTSTYFPTRSSNWVQDLDVDPTNFNIQYGSVRNLGLVKSINGGQTWDIVLNGSSFNSNHARFETSVSPADPSTIFVSVYSASNATTGINTDFYVSRNSGNSFINLNTTGSAENANLLTGQGWYDNVILAHPYNANVFYVGGVAVFKVTINGTNFTSSSIASGYDNTKINTAVHVDQHGLTTILGNNQEFRILLANDGGIYSTSFKQDPGVSQGDWSADAIGKNSTQFYGAVKQNGQDNYLAGAQDNGSWISRGDNANKSKNYTYVFGGDGYEALWHYNRSGDFLVTSQYGRIGRYVNNVYAGVADIADSGNSSIAPFYSKISSADNNPDVVFTITSRGVWRSTDFGANWNLTQIASAFGSSNNSALNVEVSPADPNVVWAGAAMTEDGSSALHVSEDNGQTYKQTNTYSSPKNNHSYNISGIGTSLTERNRAYALFSSQGAAKILKTEDLGNSWTNISGNAFSRLPDVAVHSILEMPFDQNILWAGTDIGIFETEDGGASWSLLNGFIPVAVYDMKIVNNQVVIATYGRGIWSATLSQLDEYMVAPFMTLPEVSAVQKNIESLKTIVKYNVTANQVNRVKIFIDDVAQTEVLQNFDTGVIYEYETVNLQEGVHKVGVQLFDDANNNQTTIKEYQFDVIDYEAPSQNIGITEFKAADVYIYNDDFIVDTMNGAVSSLVLNNSDHPYLDNKTYVNVFKKPLIITKSTTSFTYTDAAIVEPYSDDLSDLNNFYDFVKIEASTDGQNWTLLDKYDARRFDEWLDEYNKGANASISDNLFKSQTISLTDKGFSIGDTIVIRFVLTTDAGATSFGWAIKSIEGAVASIVDVVNEVKLFSVYPTISNGNFTVFGKNTLGKSKLKLVDITGKTVFYSSLNFNNNEKQKVSVNLSSGVYFVELIGENNKRGTSKLILE
ncbi:MULTISPECIES: T9SS type A sorting domain-containing protein [unclassified Polaribacter]|uniref:T9SS type A sorting domain-containing protein n=1 Tax=unclassified Polaribacter TaxID=196858 RepID=UPI0011BF048D|nr:MULTISPECIES: T9SS type A sorting domain-containing protein [unclassified Polaribacter]TXD53201.1 T9SS type A sorting domain-containing protein [Polaribacter sp. IC063]TXD61348.1 T9SS type A sorting domain-containing protein [Polaribacter sp. IC066]